MSHNIYILLTMCHHKAKRSSERVWGSKGEVKEAVEETNATSRRRRVRGGGQQGQVIVKGRHSKRAIWLMGTNYKCMEQGL